MPIANIANGTKVDNKMEEKLIDLIIELKKGYMEDEKQIRTLCKVSLAEYKAILEIKTKEIITCNVLSEKMGLSISRGSRIIDSLVRKRYLLRMENPEDRRSFILSLSSKGVKIKKQIEQERNNCEYRLRKNLSAREVKLIKEGLELIAKVFNQ
ncbi:MAG: MarR family transcriptional regulator [Candidatus Caldatribacteriota bacterium]|nr:MarR family transcriptional regulator [Candidatus Caldatribacteriota bacterium]